MTKKRMLLAVMIFLILLGLHAGIAWAQTDTDAAESGSTTIGTFWQLTGYAGIFRWPLFLTFVLGIAVVIRQSIALYLDWKKSSSFFHLDFKRYKDPGQLSLLARQNPSSAAALIEMLLETLKTSPDAAKFNEELVKYTEVKKQNFSTFQNRMAFWSDTAGALGLLGTVWGMFITFFRGDMDQQAILSGMGIALITTLMGLVISIILNFCTTEVSGFFNTFLKRISEISERLWRYVIETSPIPAAVPAAGKIPATAPYRGEREPSSSPQSKTSAPQTAKKTEEAEEPVRFKLIPVSGDKQRAAMNQKLSKPLIVECLQVQGNKEVKKSGEEILFESLNKIGIFDNGESLIHVQTDKSGRAQVFFTPQKQNGSCKIQVKHPKQPADPIHFDLEVLPVEPADFMIKSGNNQSAQAGKPLPEPIMIKVVDESGNPVPGCAVQFQVEMGDGKFANGKSKVDVETDSEGLASVEFTLGGTPGFNAIKAGVEKISQKRISIQALGQ